MRSSGSQPSVSSAASAAPCSALDNPSNAAIRPPRSKYSAGSARPTSPKLVAFSIASRTRVAISPAVRERHDRILQREPHDAALVDDSHVANLARAAQCTDGRAAALVRGRRARQLKDGKLARFAAQRLCRRAPAVHPRCRLAEPPNRPARSRPRRSPALDFAGCRSRFRPRRDPARRPPRRLGRRPRAECCAISCGDGATIVRSTESRTSASATPIGAITSASRAMRYGKCTSSASAGISAPAPPPPPTIVMLSRSSE